MKDIEKKKQMIEDFKKFLCDEAGIMYDSINSSLLNMSNSDIALLILIKAMWKINRENNKWVISMQGDLIMCQNDEIIETFLYKKYNNSEQQALEAALQYIYSEETK